MSNFKGQASIRFILKAAVSTAFLFFVTTCGGGGGNGNVSSQGSGSTVEAFVDFSIFSSVPKGGGSKACAFTCEFSYTANSVLKNAQEFSSLNFMCDANGVPESGQGIDVQFAFDPNDEDVKAGGTVEVSCGPSGATIIDSITFNFFSDSLPFISQDCVNSGNCTTTLELTSLKDEVTSSGVLPVLGKLQCPALLLAQSLFCTSSSSSSTSQPADAGVFCDGIASALTSQGCVPSSSTCGNNQLDS